MTLLKGICLLAVCLTLASERSFAQARAMGPTCFTGYITKMTRFDGYADSLDVNLGVPSSCNRHWFFTTYTDTPVKISFTPQVVAPCLPGDGVTMRYQIFKDGDPNPVAAWGDTNTYVPANYLQNSPISFTPTQKGNYYIVFQNYVFGDWGLTQVGVFTAIPKVEKVWIEATPICASGFTTPANGKMHFKIKTQPAIDSIMFFSALDKLPVSGSCYYQQTLRLSIDCDVNGTDVYSTYRDSNALFINPITTILPHPNDVCGSVWSHYDLTKQDDFWIDYSAVSNYITGSQKGKPVIINLNFSDGVIMNRTYHAPWIITFPSGTTLATGALAGQSPYHSASYTAAPGSGAYELWTPDNNPAAAMYGNTQTVYKIKDSLVIPAGKILEIQDMEIEFGPSAALLIKTEPGGGKAGGYLNLVNTKLTANHDCGNGSALWQGVRVWGDATQAQTVTSTSLGVGQSKQGTLDMNGAEISYANWGVINAGPNAASGPAAGKGWSTSGGVILCYGSKFYNNVRAINYGLYPVNGISPTSATSTPYRSSFTKCNFIDDAYAPGFIGFISGWAVNGVGIAGCTFTDNTGSTGSFRYGVNGYDFGVKIDQYKAAAGTAIPSKFYNLRRAVDLSNSSAGITATCLVANSLFSNNDTSISVQQLPAPQMYYNFITVPGGDVNNVKLGIFVNTGSNYGIDYNALAGATGTSYHTGVTIRNTGNYDNLVNVNSYSNLWCANLSNGLNRNAGSQISGLQFLCNSNSSNTHDIAGRADRFGISFPGSAPANGMRDDQGSSAKAAGNSMSSGGLFNIYNYTPEVHSINYYYSSGQFPPKFYGGNPIFASSNPCSYSDPNGVPIRNGGPKNGRRLAYFISDPDGIQYRDSLYLELTDWQSAYSDLLKTDLLIEDGAIDDANTLYDGIVTANSLVDREADEFSIWGRRIMDLKIAIKQDGKTPDDLTTAQVQNLTGIADSATMWAQERARAWLHIYDGRTFVTELFFPTDDTTDEQGGGSARMAYTGMAKPAPFYALSPNPVIDQLQISYYKETNVDNLITISDITGRVVAKTTLAGQAGNFNMDVHALQAGIYLYCITQNGELKTSGKLSKQ